MDPPIATSMDSLREVRGAVAERLADTVGEMMDLRFVAMALDELLSDWPAIAPFGPDTIEARALWIAAVVTYGRCFRTGVRTAGSANTIVDKIDPDRTADHRYLLDLRDKHVAHSVNAFESTQIGAVLGPAPDFEVLDVNPVGQMAVLPERSRVEGCQSLIVELIRMLSETMTLLGVELIKDVQALTPAARGALPPLVITPASPATDPSRRRSR
jgi:hypothetical protein